MKTVGAYEAKTKLAALLDRVEKGEKVAISRHGVKVALLVPPDAGRRDTPAVLDDLRAFRAGRRLGARLRDLIEDGRRR